MSSGAATPSESTDGGRPWFVAALLVALPLLPAVATALWHPHRPDWAVLRAPVVEVRQVDLATARGEFPDALWLDAREPGAYAAGHVPDALPMGETEWDNNFAGLMDAWRWSVLSTPFPPTWAFLYAVGVSLACLIIGALVFRRMERNFADVI